VTAGIILLMAIHSQDEKFYNTISDSRTNYLESLNPSELCSQKMNEMYGSALQGEARQEAMRVCTLMVGNYIESQK